MNAVAFRAAVAIFLLGLAAGPVHAITYSASLLHPGGFLESRAQGANGTRQVGHGHGAATGFNTHAFLWTGPSATRTDLTPANMTATYATEVSRTRQVGYGFGTATGGAFHALMWSGSAASMVDLHPAGLDYSYAHGTFDNGDNIFSQVGYGAGASTGNNAHALLWSNTAASKVDLHPSGFIESYAFGTNGTRQVGYGITDSGAARALAWNGTAASRVVLHPLTGFTETWANAIFGSQQVGYGYGSATSDNTHALMWIGNSAVPTNLNPAGYTFSEALAISAAGQVGSASGPATGGDIHAFWWKGTAASAVDLHPLLADLGIDFVSSSATGIADNGTIVGYATDEELNSYAVMWTPLFGDYNDDGSVDAADYIIWRKTGATLRNEYVTLGTKNAPDYDAWRSFFGSSPTSDVAADSPAPVPEPSAIVLLIGCHWLCRCFQRTAKRHTKSRSS
jgi:hypothetical protein